ncbi:MAG: hypothetical protein MUP17_02095 [candidate division Zixibacteria bacterium]|nr:hypothetical protein [candidate division Zixibacteria bacterium]
MINDIALKHFDELWSLFDRVMLGFLGSDFLIEPFRQFFSRSFVEQLTEEKAKNNLHIQLLEWGRIEQSEYEIEIIETLELPDGTKYEKTQFKDPKVRWARNFILTAFYNLCCLAAHKVTIEELIFSAYKDINKSKTDRKDIKAFYKLIGISNSFLLSEWAQDIVEKAIANSDKDFFRGMTRWLNEDTPSKKFDTASTWLGTTLLWYLGGKDLLRREFMLLLKQKGILSPQMQELSFNAILSKLHLFKNLDITK